MGSTRDRRRRRARHRQRCRRGSVGAYQLQAAIAAIHDEAARAEDTDWPQILALYGLLERMSDNPMVALNHAIAVAMVNGPAAGLELLDTARGDAATDRSLSPRRRSRAPARDGRRPSRPRSSTTGPPRQRRRAFPSGTTSPPKPHGWRSHAASRSSAQTRLDREFLRLRSNHRSRFGCAVVSFSLHPARSDSSQLISPKRESCSRAVGVSMGLCQRAYPFFSCRGRAHDARRQTTHAALRARGIAIGIDRTTHAV